LKKIDKYIIMSFVGPFFAILAFVVFALMMQFLWLYIDELVGKGLSLKIIMEFMGWGSVTMLPLSLPLATVLASVMTMGAMAENSELIALKSAGISITRIFAPLVAVCMAIAVGTFFVSNNLLPMAYNNIYSLRDDIGKTKEEIHIPTKTFYDGIEDYILRVDSSDKKTGMMYKVMVYNHTSNKGNVSMAIADSAIMKMSPDKTFLTFAMYNGVNYEETNDRSSRDTTCQIQRTEFTSQQMIIPLEHYSFEKTEVGRFSDQAKSMTLGDLKITQDSIRLQLSGRKSQEVARLRSDFSTLDFNRQLDTSKVSEYRSIFPLDSLKELDLPKQIIAHESAVQRLDNFIADMTNYEREIGLAAMQQKLVSIEVFKKFSLALCCFLLFFIGAPLGALIRKGGIGTPAIISILLFVVYYIADIVGTKLSRDGAITPFLGAFIASFVLMPICAFFCWKAIKDEPILGMDNIRNWLRKTRTRFMEIFKKTNIIYMGTPEFAVAPLKALLDKGFNVVAVVTVPDKPSGRGQEMNQSAVKKFAVQRDIPVLQPENLRSEEFISALKSYKPDIFAVVAFRLLPREVFTIPTRGCFNLHAALLPQYRGAAPINWAVINGEKITGVTSFLIDDGVDTGTILIREQYRITPEQTASDVHDALMEMGARVVVQTVEGLMEGHLDTRVQKSFIQGEEVLHKAPKLSRELCHIDWSDTPEHIVNLIRGLSDYPGAFTELVAPDGQKTMLKIYRAHIENGKVVPDQVQLAGKKRMSFEDFLRGFRDYDSYTFSTGTSKEVIEAVHASEKTE